MVSKISVFILTVSVILVSGISYGSSKYVDKLNSIELDKEADLFDEIVSNAEKYEFDKAEELNKTFKILIQGMNKDENYNINDNHTYKIIMENVNYYKNEYKDNKELKQEIDYLYSCGTGLGNTLLKFSGFGGENKNDIARCINKHIDRINEINKKGYLKKEAYDEAKKAVNEAIKRYELESGVNNVDQSYGNNISSKSNKSTSNDYEILSKNEDARINVYGGMSTDRISMYLSNVCSNTSKYSMKLDAKSQKTSWKENNTNNYTMTNEYAFFPRAEDYPVVVNISYSACSVGEAHTINTSVLINKPGFKIDASSRYQ